MMPVMPVLANGSTYITVKARDVVNMAHNAIAEIENKRSVAVREQLKECMEEECVHRIPLLGIPYYRHKRYPNTDIAVWVLLIIAGHPILATFKVASFLVSCMLIGVARRLYRERLGIKTDEDIQNEFAQHRAHVRQVNNVVGGDLAGGDIIKTK